MKTSRILLPLIVLLAAVIVAGCVPKAGQIPTAASPAGKAWAEGKEIYFVHTEASDAGVAEKLTNMMKSPVLLVPSLAKMPADALAQVYVFTNGVAGKGPFGFQSDVFPNPPGSDGYSPLRNINAVTWADPAKARESNRWPKSWPLRMPGKSRSSSRGSSSTCHSSSGTAGSAEPCNQSFLHSSPG